MATFAWVLLVVGGNAALKTAHLAVSRGVANTFWGNGAGSGFALSFGTEFFDHERAPENSLKSRLSMLREPMECHGQTRLLAS
ncbi:MAG: hypothetical protein IPN53_07440 [Comamonadaceae bacterium]|nr:hypothetical protein [Comamonadaceae bacterium]